jgi:hypothetical protein
MNFSMAVSSVNEFFDDTRPYRKNKPQMHEQSADMRWILTFVLTGVHLPRAARHLNPDHSDTYTCRRSQFRCGGKKAGGVRPSLRRPRQEPHRVQLALRRQRSSTLLALPSAWPWRSRSDSKPAAARRPFAAAAAHLLISAYLCWVGLVGPASCWARLGMRLLVLFLPCMDSSFGSQG